MLNDILKKLFNKESLTQEEAEECMNNIMEGDCTPVQISAFLVALKMKGETIEEIAGCAKSMKNHAVRFNILKENSYVIDTCGTGGDGGKTFNISTAVAIIAAAANISVAKHGNRAVSSKCGCADVLKEFGLNIEMNREQSEICMKETGMTFLFAPNYHKSMKYAAAVRGDLGVRTIFNILGPLTNPADIKGQVMGIFDGSLTEPIAQVLLKLGRERAMVVHGEDGLDEITTTTKTKISEIRDGKIVTYYIDPRDYGIPLADISSIGGGTAKENAAIIKSIFLGEKGPKRDIVVLNSAAALFVGKVVGTMEEGIRYANDIITTGTALKKLNEIVSYTRGISA